MLGVTVADRIRWGIIAPGSIAEQFAAAIGVVEDAEVLAIASRSEERARKFAGKFAISRIYKTYGDLAGDPDINAVYVASPHTFHAEQTLLCLRHGKAVLCEKPLAVNAGQVREIIGLAKKNNVFFMEALWSRFLPAIQAAKSCLAEIGDVQRIQADFSFYHPLPDEHRCMNPDLAGGALLDLGVYVLNFARMFSDDWPEESFSVVQIGRTGVDLQEGIVLKYRSGIIAQLSCGINIPGPCTATVYGTRGLIEFPANFHAAQQAVVRNNMGERVIREPFRKNGFEYEIEEVHSCIRKGRIESDVMSWDESLKITEQMDSFRAQWGLKYPFE